MDKKPVISNNNYIQNSDGNKLDKMAMSITPQDMIVETVIGIARESMMCFTDYLKCKQHEATERQRIKATLSAINAKISAQKEVYIKTIETNYAERKELYSRADKVMKYALEMHDMEMVKCSYNYLLNIYAGANTTTIQLASQFNNENKMIDFID